MTEETSYFGYKEIIPLFESIVEETVRVDDIWLICNECVPDKIDAKTGKIFSNLATELVKHMCISLGYYPLWRHDYNAVLDNQSETIQRLVSILDLPDEDTVKKIFTTEQYRGCYTTFLFNTHNFSLGENPLIYGGEKYVDEFRSDFEKAVTKIISNTESSSN